MFSVLALVLALLGFSLLAYALPLAFRARASRAWPETAGKITAVNVAKVWIGRGSVYYPEVRYEYAGEATKEEGTRICFAAILPRFSHGATVYALQHSYPRGRQVRVRYNPLDLRDTVLEPGIRPGLRTILAAGALLVLLALAAAVAARLLDAAAA